MHSDLIFDIGMHLAEDTEFYLKKGFRVVAIEADPAYCANAAARFASEIAEGRLVVVNKAIAEASGTISFYRSLHNSAWGTLYPEWMERNRKLGGEKVERIDVQAVRMEEIYSTFGIPYYLKVDIEGADILCLKALRNEVSRPKYLSIESDKVTLRAIGQELSLMSELGYDRFKLVPQHLVPNQRPPEPSLEGLFVDHNFTVGASGLFGEEAPGVWVDQQTALRRYLPIFFRYRVVGDDPINGLVKRVAARLGLRAGWYDTHAKLGSSKADRASGAA